MRRARRRGGAGRGGGIASRPNGSARPPPRAAGSGNAGEEALNAALTEGIAGEAEWVLLGFNWTYVEGPAGAGLCQTPARGSAGCRSLPEPGGYRGRALADLAALVASDNGLERALGFAAINAHHNRYALGGECANGLDLLDPDAPSVVMGRFPDLDRRLPGAKVIEREPGPGDYPESAAATLIPAAAQIAITSATIANGSLGRILALARADAFCALLGPSTPLCPALFAYGIDALSGLVVVDRERARRVIAEGGAVRALHPVTRMVTLRP